MTAERHTDSVVITAILPLSAAPPLMKKLRHEQNLTTANMNHARGHGVSAAHMSGLPPATEKDVLTVVVDRDRADEIFNFMFFEGQINRPHGGIIYMSEPAHAMPFLLPDGLPEDD